MDYKAQWYYDLFGKQDAESYQRDDHQVINSDNTLINYEELFFCVIFKN